MSPAAIAEPPKSRPLDADGRATAARVHRGNGSLEGFLNIRVRGPGCQGRIVQIRSAKCTIGSAAGCTLRLHSPHVPRLACWIVRGTEKIAARRFEGALTVNGAAFELVELKPGDRLLVGNIELELLPSGPAEDTTDTRPAASLGQPGGSGPSADQTEGDDAIRAMEARLEEALRKVAQLEQESHQGFGASILAAERAEQMHEALAAAHRELEETAAELVQTRAELAQTQLELTQIRAEWEQARATLARSHAELAQARLERDRLQAEIRQHASKDPSRAEMDARAAELTALAAQLAQRQAELDARQVEWNTFRAELQARQKELDTRREELDSRHAVLESRQEELDARQLKLDAQEADVKARQAALDAREAALTKREAQWKQQEAELQARAEQLAAQSADLSSQTRALVQEKAELASRAAEVASRAADLEARETALRQRGEELDRQATELAQRSKELDERAEELEKYLDEVQRRLAELERMQAKLASSTASARGSEESSAAAWSSGNSATLVMTGLSPWPTGPEPSRDDAATIAAQAAPLSQKQVLNEEEPAAAGEASATSKTGDIETVLGRLVRAGLWRDEAESSQQPLRERPVSASVDRGASDRPSSALNERPASVQAEPPPALSREPSGTPESPPATLARQPVAEEEEESIEAYMARLLERVRGDSGTSPAPREVDVAPPPTPAPPPSPAPSEPAQKLTPEAYVPRTSAPESQTHLSALREVANVAARVAVTRYTRRRAATEAAGKLLRGLLTGAGGLAAAYWAWRAGSLPGLVGATIGGLTGVAWMLGAMKKLLAAILLGNCGQVSTPPTSPNDAS